MTQTDYDLTLYAWLRLSLEPGIGSVHARKLIDLLGQPEQIYRACQNNKAPAVPPKLVYQLAQKISAKMEQQIHKTLDWLAHPDHHVLTLSHKLYPARLLDLHDAPIVLYVQGQLHTLQSNMIAIVGARNATLSGQDHAHQFAYHLTQSGWTILSGMALGIDAAAHRGALKNPQALSLAVVGTGVNLVYPKNHHQLAHQLCQQGAILSEFPLDTPSLAHHFPRRNRLVAALAQGILVVEAGINSGSLITAKQAADLGREVFAIPGSINAPLSKGCHALIRDGAKLVETAQDILEELNCPYPSLTLQNTPTNDLEHPILSSLGFDPISFDDLLTHSNLSANYLQSQLLALELNGQIERLPGGRYQRRN